MRKTFTLSLLVSIILPICLLSCSQASHNQPQAQDKLKEGTSQVIDTKEQAWQQVTVNFYDFEGGFYGLTSKTGDKLLPMNLAKQYKLAGTVLKVKGEIIKDMMTTQQWGQPFRITSIELIKLGQKSENNKGAEY
ncbi:hypothetical protein ESZ36_16140 [Colwellia demingiae]|uniref:Pilus assembly protein PilP n=1 Tax=Colwellia demingiae TaxID=89401 RepID=A0A5C6QCA7_9GAMM|nr:hypothetical protein ESZ36_16140 [Colwellia demingiae]